VRRIIRGQTNHRSDQSLGGMDNFGTNSVRYYFFYIYIYIYTQSTKKEVQNMHKKCKKQKQNKTTCGAGHNKPRPLANATDSELWPVITNNLTFDPPTLLPELTHNVIRSTHGHSTPSLKISCKSVQPFSRNVADKEINNKQRKKSLEINTPSPYRGGSKN